MENDYGHSGPKESLNKIRILQTKFEFVKNEFNIPDLKAASLPFLAL